MKRNHKIVYKTGAEMQKEFQQKRMEYKKHKIANPRACADGFITKGEGIFEYNRVEYIIKVLRYYNQRAGFAPMCSGRVCDCHCVVEYTNNMEKINKMLNELGINYEFLWHDTLHTCNDKQTEEQQIEECHRLAQRDIDNLPSFMKKAKSLLNGQLDTLDKFV